MPPEAALPAAGAGAGPSNAGGGAAATSGAGAGSGDSGGHVDTGAGADTGAGDGAAAPKSFKFSIEEGETPVDFSLEDDAAADTHQAEPFKFESLDALKESNPDLYKTLKPELSKLTRYSKTFKTPEEAQQHVQRVDKLVSTIARQDGKVGLDAVEATLGEFANVVNKAMTGDAATISGWFKDNPAAGQLGEAFAQQWAANDESGYIAHVAKAAWSALTSKDAGGLSVIGALNALIQLPELKGNADAQRLYARIKHTMDGIANNSEYTPDQTPVLKAREQTLAQREAKLWQNETDAQVKPMIQQAARKMLSSLTSELKKTLTAEERTEYLGILETSFYKKVGADQDFQSKLSQMIKSQDREGIKDLIKGVRTKYIIAAGKDLQRAKLLNRKGIRDEAADKGEAGGGSGAAAAGGAKAVKYTGKIDSRTQAPAVDFDYARMSAEDAETGGTMAMDGFFYIKGKKEKYSRW